MFDLASCSNISCLCDRLGMGWEESYSSLSSGSGWYFTEFLTRVWNSIFNISIFFLFRPHFREKSTHQLTSPRAISEAASPRIASKLTLELTLKITLKVTLKSTHRPYFERKINILDHIVLISNQSALYRFTLKLSRSHYTSPCVDLIQKRPHRRTLARILL